MRWRPNAAMRWSSVTTSATSAYATGSKHPRSIELTRMLAAIVQIGASSPIWVPSSAMNTLRTNSAPVISGRRPMRSERFPAHALANDCPTFATRQIRP